MNHSNTRFLSLASLTLFLGLVPLACGDDDDDTNPGTAGRGGTSSTAGTTGNNGGDGGTRTTGGSGGTSGSGGSVNVGGVGGGEGGIGGGEGGAGGDGAVAKTRLRVVHASPNAPAVDIYVKGTSTAAVENVAYGNATEFLEVDAGVIAFDLRAAGADADDDPAFTTEDLTLESGSDYTLVAAGDFEEADDEDTGFRILPLEHDFETAEADTALVRVVHATSAWEDVDLDLTSTDDVDLPGLARFGSESNVALPSATTQDIEFLDGDGVVSQLVLPRLTAESEVFVIATGNPGFPFRAPANGFALLVVDQDGNTSWVKENPWLHLVHASDVGPVDIYQNAATTVRLANDVEAEALVAFQLPASTGGYTLKAVDSGAANGSASGLASGSTSTLLSGEHYLSYIAGAAIGTIREQFNLQSTDVLLRGVHAMKLGQITEQLDFGPVTGDALSDALISGVGPGMASAPAGTAIDAGDLTLGAATTGTATPLFATLELEGTAAPEAGERSFVLLTGATAATAKLYVVNTSVAGWSIR
jgi:Domain of unknown function (DUF4397)